MLVVFTFDFARIDSRLFHEIPSLMEDLRNINIARYTKNLKNDFVRNSWTWTLNSQLTNAAF